LALFFRPPPFSAQKRSKLGLFGAPRRGAARREPQGITAREIINHPLSIFHRRAILILAYMLYRYHTSPEQAVKQIPRRREELPTEKTRL
jgi:hypothetical protein